MHPPLPAAVAAHLATVVGSIPGCSLRPHVQATSPQVPMSGRIAYTLVVDGRSPSLHSIVIELPVRLATAADVQDQVDDILGQIDGVLDRQRARAAAGLELAGAAASAFPLTTGRAGLVSIMHLHVDASALAMVVAGENGSVRSHAWTPEQARRVRDAETMTSCWTRIREIGDHVQQLHNTADRYAGGGTLRKGSLAVAERSKMRVAEWSQGVRTPGSGATSCQGILHGGTLALDPFELPETLARAMSGRPLRDLVSIHPMLDGRIVRQVRTGATAGPSITLEPVLVPLSDYQDMVVGDALEKLAGIANAVPGQWMRKDDA